MKVKLEFELAAGQWQPSELVMALSRALARMGGQPGAGPVVGDEGEVLGWWEVRATPARKARTK